MYTWYAIVCYHMESYGMLCQVWLDVINHRHTLCLSGKVARVTLVNSVLPPENLQSQSAGDEC